MKIKNIKLADYEPADYNPRPDLQPGDPEFEKIRSSIEEFGWLGVPVVNDRTKHYIVGHQRIKVAKLKGITEMEAIVVDFSLEKEKAANIAVNRIGEGNWDTEKLAALFDELSRIPDFDVSVTGFNTTQISQIFDRYRNMPDDNVDYDKEASLITEAITKVGDRIELGRHVLVCGDSADLKVIAYLMGEEKADLLLTDPPYGCNYLQKRPDKQRPKKSRKWEKIYKDDLSQPEYEKWLRQILTNIEPYLVVGAPFYIWNGFRQFPHMLQTLEGLNLQTSCVIVWVKETFAISYGDYHPGCEFAIYGWKRGKQGRHPWYGGVNQSSVWSIHRDVVSSYEHPTQKALEVFARSIRNSSKQDDTVVDLFVGSGTSILASEMLGRRCFAVEHEPKYCDVAIRRMLRYAPEKISEDIRKRYLKEAQQ